MMTYLRDVKHTDLTLYVVRILQQHHIESVVDFVSAPTKNLTKATNLCSNTVEELKQYLTDAYGPQTSGCLTFKDRALSRTFLLQTGINSLDELLGPGILSGSVVELCGSVTTGKSMLLTTLAIHVARHHKFQTLFVDTKRAFSGFRIYALVKELGCSQVECGEVMNRIRVEDVSDAVGLINILRALVNQLVCVEGLDYQLLVVDSLAPLLFPYSGSHHKSGLLLLTTAMTLLKELAERRHIIVFLKALTSGDQLRNLPVKETPVVSTVSRYWPMVPSIRLYLEHVQSAEGNQIKQIRILKSNQHVSGGRCSMHLTTKGMVSSCRQ